MIYGMSLQVPKLSKEFIYNGVNFPKVVYDLKRKWWYMKSI